jgi:hypothetical protein
MLNVAPKGNTTVEYCLVISLLAVAAIASLRLLGYSTSEMLGAAPNAAGTMQMMNLDFKGAANGAGSAKTKGAVLLKGPGYYYQTIDPQTGKVGFAMTSGGNDDVTNATSLEGSEWNSLGQFEIAETLMQLAQQQSDPNSKAFILGLAKKAYYMGAAEGEIDAVKQFEWHDASSTKGDYGKMNGLVDIKRLQGDMLAALNNPPANLEPGVLQQVGALSLDVYNIGQSYVNALKDVPANAAYSFMLTSEIATGPANGKPGQALAGGSSVAGYCTDKSCGIPQSMGGPTVEEVFTIDYVRATAKEVMNQVNITPQKVVATMTDATTTEKL